MGNVEELNKLIADKGLYQKKLAENIGVSHIHLNAVLCGRARLTDNLYRRLKYHLIEKI